MSEFDEDFRRLIGDTDNLPEEDPLTDILARRRARIQSRAASRRVDNTESMQTYTMTELGRMFGVARETAAYRLRTAPPSGVNKAGMSVFTIRAAAPYLLQMDDRSDIASVLEKMKPKDLPQQLQKAYWDAKLTRQKYEIKAAELWYSEDVIDVLGEAFKMIKTQMQLWVDNLDGSTEFSSDQRSAMSAMVDSLAQDLHDVLVKMPSQRKTPSAFARDLEDED